MANSYHVKATWDPEAKVWVSSSDIPGLVIEAEDLAEFEQLVRELAPELIAENIGAHGSVRIELEARGHFDLAVA
jgi:predicted aspartyl protease